VGAVVAAIAVASYTMEGSPTPFVLLAGAFGAAVALRVPVLLIVPIGGTILLDTLGATGAKVAGIPVTASKLTVGALLVLWIPHALAYRKEIVRFTPVTGGSLAVLGSMLLSLTVQYDETFFQNGFRDMVATTLLFTLLHLMYSVVEDRDLRWLLPAFAMMVTGSLLFSAIGGIGLERASGAFANPNGWGAVVVLTAHISIGVVLGLERGRMRTAWLTVLVSLYPLTLYQSGSRGAMLAAVFISPILLYLLRREWIILATAAAAFVFVSPLLVDTDYVLSRYRAMVESQVYASQGSGVDSIVGRIFLSELAFELFLEHPLRGVGLGNYKMYSAAYYPGMGAKDAHNAYLQIAAEQGLIGVVAHGYFFVSIGWTLWNAFRNAVTKRQRYIIAGFSLGITGYAGMNFSSGKLMVFAIGYFCLALLLCTERSFRAKPEPATAPELPEPAPLAVMTRGALPQA
jgi:O-antigen ligase